MTNTFSSIEAAALFERSTGFVFHPSVPGTLLARRGIWKLPIGGRPSQFDASHWHILWGDMLTLANRRCRFDSTLAPPIDCPVPSLDQRLMEPEEASVPNVKATVPLALARGGDAPEESKRFIDVKWAEKESARAAGAKWDWSAKMWYLPLGIEAERFWAEFSGKPTTRSDWGQRGPEVGTPVRNNQSDEHHSTMSYIVESMQQESDERLAHLLFKDD